MADTVLVLRTYPDLLTLFFFFMASILPVSQAMYEILGLIYWKRG